MSLNGPFFLFGRREQSIQDESSKSVKRLFEKIRNQHVLKIDISLHPVNQNKHLNKISLLRAVGAKVLKFIYFSEEKWAGVRVASSCRNAGAQ